ncbi:MAG: type II secretion system protein [Candidatus Omnitrophota bacterium]|nr:MAG: type II secretion system protein [Candidatus Omnitrophota bacterium]
MKSAFTLTEVIATVIIVGILAALSLPLLTKAVEGTKATEAMVALKQIRTGERIYRTEEDTYWPTEAPVNNISTINAQLRLYLEAKDERNWDYSVTATADTFDATATRRSGSYNGRTITLDEGGPPFEGTWPLPLP